MVDGVRLLVVLKRHAVQFAHVLLDLVLCQERVASESDLVGFHGHIGAREDHFVADEIDLLTWLLEAAGDRWLEAFGAHIFLEIKSLLVVVLQLVEVLYLSLRWGLKVSKVFSVEIADLGRVPHLEVDLIWVVAEPLHRVNFLQRVFRLLLKLTF